MAMPAAWMPGAVRKPVPYRDEAGTFAGTPLGWILHVVVGNGSPFNTFAKAPSGSRRFSHFWVSKLGTIEQYAETFNKSWAQAGGNGTYWSVETEGFPSEPLTDAQVAALAKVHNFLGATDAIANQPGQRGIGVHYMGGTGWGGHSCPDPVGHEGDGPRSHQRDDILRAANPPPPPAPQPTTKKVLKMQWLAQTDGLSAVYLTDGIQRRWIQSQDELKSIQGFLREAGLSDAVRPYSAGNIDKGMAGVLVGPEAPDGTH